MDNNDAFLERQAILYMARAAQNPNVWIEITNLADSRNNPSPRGPEDILKTIGKIKDNLASKCIDTMSGDLFAVRWVIGNTEE